MNLRGWFQVAACLGAALPAYAADAPAEIKIGALYAGSGPVASASLPLHSALEMWADGVNKAGGVLRQRLRQEDPGPADRL